MPLKNGHYTPQERTFIENYAATADPIFSATAAGYGTPRSRASEALARPAVQAEIARLQIERLTNEVLPLAVDVHIALLRSPKTPAGALVQAVKLAYDRALGTDNPEGKAPHEMTGDELAAAIERLKREAVERSKPIIDNAPAPGVFD